MLGRFASIMGGAFFAATLAMCMIGSCTAQPFQPVVTNYTTQNGECWVRPQGDGIYDQFYAQQVNPSNCESFVREAQGNSINADTRRTNVETTYGLTLGYGTLSVVVIMLGLLLVVIIRG